MIPLFFFTIALARPQWSKNHHLYNKSGVDIVLTIDVSESMEIRDFFIKGRQVMRIDAAKKLSKEFIEKRPHDRIGVAAFAGRPYQVSPITMNHEWLPQLIDQEVIYSETATKGTALGSAISYAATRLDTKAKNSKSKIIILITDGSWNSGKISPEMAATLAKDLNIKIYSLAIGTEWGRLERHRFFAPKQEFDTATLKRVAEIGNGKYYRIKKTEELKAAFDEIDQLEKVEAPVTSYREVKEYHHWLTLAGLISLVTIFFFSNTVFSKPE